MNRHECLNGSRGGGYRIGMAIAIPVPMHAAQKWPRFWGNGMHQKGRHIRIAEFRRSIMVKACCFLSRL
ncbi:hypothetical protein EB231_21385 [Mesorhizobium sp. NZP2298]|nr:hypothetical protein EB231_21385 [Mesorhizobium sp. NZP2298]